MSWNLTFSLAVSTGFTNMLPFIMSHYRGRLSTSVFLDNDRDKVHSPTCPDLVDISVYTTHNILHISKFQRNTVSGFCQILSLDGNIIEDICRVQVEQNVLEVPTFFTFFTFFMNQWRCARSRSRVEEEKVQATRFADLKGAWRGSRPRSGQN